MPLFLTALPSTGTTGLVEYDSREDLPSSAPDGTRAVLRGALVEYNSGWDYVTVPCAPEGQGGTQRQQMVPALAGMGTQVFLGEPPTQTTGAGGTSAMTLVP
jgi:hypothetical protein